MRNDEREIFPENVKADINHLKRTCDQLLVLAKKADFRVDKGEEDTGNRKLRMKTVQLVKGLLSLLRTVPLLIFMNIRRSLRPLPI